MSEPQTPASIPPEQHVDTADSSQKLLREPAHKFPGEGIFLDGENVRVEWKVLAYFGFWWITM